jgi:dsRNA-specific ribonuclease
MVMNTDEDLTLITREDGTEYYRYHPYNPVNVQITDKDILGILKSYGINVPIRNYALYRRAFIHRSYTKRPDEENAANNIVLDEKPDDCLALSTKSNERLEFLGDGVLECVTKYYLYRRFPKEQEGFMTEKKIALVKNESIGRIAYDMGLHKWLIMSNNMEMRQTRTNLKKLGCLFEAFLGALFLDTNQIELNDDNWYSSMFVTGPGFQVAQKFVENIFERHIDWGSLVNNDDNYKNLLQVRIQKEFKVTPHYMEVNSFDVELGYHMGVYLCLGQDIYGLKHMHADSASAYNSFHDIHEKMGQLKRVFVCLGEGRHRIKKKAEQIACKAAIDVLNKYT